MIGVNHFLKGRLKIPGPSFLKVGAGYHYPLDTSQSRVQVLTEQTTLSPGK